MKPFLIIILLAFISFTGDGQSASKKIRGYFFQFHSGVYFVQKRKALQELNLKSLIKSAIVFKLDLTRDMYYKFETLNTVTSDSCLLYVNVNDTSFFEPLAVRIGKCTITVEIEKSKIIFDNLYYPENVNIKIIYKKEMAYIKPKVIKYISDISDSK